MEGPPNAFTLLGGMVRPQSRGTIRLSGPDADDPLLIDPQILSAEADLVALEASLAQVREMGAAPALREWGARELYPGPEVTHRGRRSATTCGAPPSATTTRSAPARWASTPRRSSTRGCACTGSRA